MEKMRDFTGDEVNVPEEPGRIISFSPSVTEILFELGLGDRLVGVSAFCARPKETSSVRKVGSYGSARMEVLRDLKPDLIMTISGFQSDFSEKLKKEFTVFNFELPSSVAGIVDLVSKVGVVVNRMEEARLMEFELLKIISGIRRHTRIRGYYEIDLGGPVTFGSESYITDALEVLGIRTPYTDRKKEWIEPNFDHVREFDPELIIYEPKMYQSVEDNAVLDLLKKRGWADITALRQGHLFKTPGKLDFFAHHGPSFIRTVLPWTVSILDSIF
ncbi:MAG: ABC transporter substrate-binding protein [Candidatus Thermoplasmatota archaeon]|nr:ABC transporter substrate-binding protein [Candidatus Thermoplasmatota archaeon]